MERVGKAEGHKRVKERRGCGEGRRGGWYKESEARGEAREGRRGRRQGSRR